MCEAALGTMPAGGNSTADCTTFLVKDQLGHQKRVITKPAGCKLPQPGSAMPVHANLQLLSECATLDATKNCSGVSRAPMLAIAATVPALNSNPVMLQLCHVSSRDAAHSALKNHKGILPQRLVQPTSTHSTTPAIHVAAGVVQEGPTMLLPPQPCPLPPHALHHLEALVVVRNGQAGRGHF